MIRPWRPSRVNTKYGARCHLFPKLLGRCSSKRNFHNPLKQEKSLDDQTLRQIFDSQKFWHQYSQKSLTDSTLPRRGLLQNRFLIEPKGFLIYAHITQVRCQRIVDDVLSATTVEDYATIPRKLDLLSDSLCRILDVADFVRAAHPDVAFQKAASQAYAYLFEYMNVLNTTPGLNAQLQKAVSTSSARAWTEEENTVVQVLLKDFSQSAIRLPEDKRNRFVELSNQMKQTGAEFVENMARKRDYIDLDESQMKGLSPLLVAKYRTRPGRVSLPINGGVTHTALRSVQQESARRDIYVASRQCPEDHIQRLEKFLQIRAEVASLIGQQSYAHQILTDKLAKSPEAVHSFLTALSRDNAPYVTQELAQMRKLKEQDNGLSEIQPWDVEYLTKKLNAGVQSRSRKPDFLAAYFSLGTVMQGLSRLFSRLFGICLVPRETAPGETWNDDVRRVDVMHETEGHVAVLYCDLFARSGKTPNPCHFTLRCSRLISSTELAETSSSPEEANDGMPLSSPDTNGECHQLPVIALVCDFPVPKNQHTPALLTFQDVKTLFHEMGHAIHSILGRTNLQVVSGTRCPTDMAELPSVLMEHFASDASVLALFARHWETDAPLPYQMVQDVLQANKRGQGLQIETQILFSLLDQAYHSSLPLKMRDSFDSSKLLFDVYDRYGSLREPRETTPQGLFGHLVEYGGTYYSYLFDRAIAGKVWREVFRSGKDGGAVDREAGERYKKELLKWGGARNGWVCISGLLGDERLRDGGEKAMEEVGRWGVHD
ncbi:Mitochondrial intermediate peptidase [Lecanora helva]